MGDERRIHPIQLCTQHPLRQAYTCGTQGKGKTKIFARRYAVSVKLFTVWRILAPTGNYCELALRELGYHNVFPHCGTDSEINLHGKRVYPIVTGTFGAVDFLHSVIGEANDHFTQSEVDEVDVA